MAQLAPSSVPSPTEIQACKSQLQWDRGGPGVVSFASIREDVSSIHNTTKPENCGKPWSLLTLLVAMSLRLVLAPVLMSANSAGGPEPAQCAQGLCVPHRTHPAWFTLMGQKFLAYNETGCSTKLL